MASSPGLSALPDQLPAHSSRELRFLCDEMLQRLGHWLRAAGYDTLIENNGRSDYALLCQAIDEGRYLVTRDRKLMEHRRAAGTVILLDADNLEACVESLSKQLPVDWQFAPFVRCTVCNSELTKATQEQIASLPATLNQRLSQAFYCPQCEQVYWEGSHVRRMRKQLQQWHTRYNA